MKRALPFVLLAVVALLVCAGVALLAVNALLPRGDAIDLNTWKTVVSQVDRTKIAPAAALETLAGTRSQQAVDDALQQGAWESAYATLAYSTDIGDGDRAGTLLLLGSRLAAAQDTARAAWCYEYAAELATLSPALSDLVRAQTLLEAAQGLSSLKLSSASRRAVDQAFLIAQYSPDIPVGARSRLYTAIAQNYTQLGAAALSRAARQKGDEATGQTGEDSPTSARLPYRLAAGDWKITGLADTKRQARIESAKQLMDEVALKPPKSDSDVPSDLVADLHDKLIDEDETLKTLYDATDSGDPDAASRAAILQSKIQWLGYKLQIAKRGFGISIVPDWETDAENIATELSDAQDAYFKLAEQEAALADEPAATRNTQDVLRSELVAGRWGLYRSDENDLRTRLQDVTSKLKDEEVNALRLDSFMRGSSLEFLLVPDSLYGQGEQALPK